MRMIPTTTALTLALALTASLATALPAAAQTVILVRHAEKVDASADPDLSEAGYVRAEALAAVLADAGVTQAWSTPLARTRLTATPTAAAAGIEVGTLSLEGGGAAHVARVVEMLRAAGPDEVILVSGHSNTVPDIARALGVADEPPMSDCEYDRLLVIDLDGGGARVVRGRYGAPSGGC